MLRRRAGRDSSSRGHYSVTRASPRLSVIKLQGRPNLQHGSRRRAAKSESSLPERTRPDKFFCRVGLPGPRASAIWRPRAEAYLCDTIWKNRRSGGRWLLYYVRLYHPPLPFPAPPSLTPPPPPPSPTVRARAGRRIQALLSNKLCLYYSVSDTPFSGPVTRQVPASPALSQKLQLMFGWLLDLHRGIIRSGGERPLMTQLLQQD